MSDEPLDVLAHGRYSANLELDRHATLIRLRAVELKNPEHARWHRNEDGSLYRKPTEISEALDAATNAMRARV